MFSLRNLMNRLSNQSRNQRRVAARRAHSPKLCLESLESREVPSTTLTWTGLGDVASASNPNPNADWSNALNWSGKAAPVSGDALIFESSPSATTSINDLSAGTLISSITIEGKGYDITGNAIDLQKGISETNTSGTNTVALDITMTAAQTFNSSGVGGNLIVSGSIDNGGYLLTGNAGGVLTFNGSIGGSGGFLMTGANKLNLANTNSFTGTTTVDSGTMYLDAQNGNAISGNLVVGDGVGSNESDVVREALANQIADTSSVSTAWTGLLDLNGYDDTIGSLTMNGGNVTSGTGVLNVNGPITTTASSYTAVIAANLDLGSGSSQTFNIASGTAGTDLNIKGTITGNSGVEFIKAGAGTLRLSGNDSYSGPTLVSAGTLVAATDDALGSSAATVNSGATLTFANPNSTGSLAFNANPVTLNGGTLEASGSVTLPGQLILAADSTIDVNSSNTLDQTGVVSGSGDLDKTWAGTLNLDTANTYSGSTTVTNGVLALYNSEALGDTSGVKVGNTGTLALENGLTFSPIALTLNSTGNADAALFSNGNAAWEGSINLTGDSNIDVAAGGQLTLSGQITGAAANTLTIGDPTGDAKANGVVMLTSANTYAGATIVANGTLAIDNATALGSPAGKSATNNGTTVDAGATLELLGGISFDPTEALTLNGSGFDAEGALVNADGDNTWAGTINLSTTSTITTDAGTDFNISGVINGSQTSNLITTGTGTLTLSGTNTFEGYVKILEGIVALDNAQALGGAPLNGGSGTTVEAGATLQLEGFTYVIEPLTLNGNGVGGTEGALEVASGINQWAGPIKLGSAATIVADAGASLTDDIQIANEGYNLTFNGPGNITLGTAISGSGGLIKDGSGMLTLSGVDGNSYTGATTVNQGILMLSKPSTVYSVTGAGITINSGATVEGQGRSTATSP